MPSTILPFTNLFHDKAWCRADMAYWDARWAKLSLGARRDVLESIRTGPYATGPRPVNTQLPVSLQELVRAEFIETHPQGYVVAESAVGFINRVRSLKRYALLDPSQPSQSERYINQVFATFDLAGVIADVAEKQTGLHRSQQSGDPFEMYVRCATWPDWVAAFLADPLAKPIIEAIDSAGVPVPISSLVTLLKSHPPDEVRATFDALVNHLVLFEDIDPKTYAIRTGLLPTVAQARHKGEHRRVPKPEMKLEACEAMKVGPATGVGIPDLRAILLEITAERPRLKQDGMPFQKDRDRLWQVLDPIPEWLFGSGDAVAEGRLQRALAIADRLDFVRNVKGPDKTRLLELTSDGRDWLGLDRESQYDVLFDDIRENRPPKIYPYTYGETGFLGTDVIARPFGSSRRAMSAEDYQRLRDAIYAVFSEIPINTFFSVEQFINRASEPKRNPLMLGRTAREIEVVIGPRYVPRLDEHFIAASRNLLEQLITHRLVGLGCVQMAQDAKGRILFARMPRLDAYFGKVSERPEQPAQESRVIVQPDYTIVVIGLDTRPIAQLSPFCDRVQGSADQGALTFRISRESIYRGIGGGMKPDDIPAILARLCPAGMPQNVQKEVTRWCSQTQEVTTSTVTLIRCPDADTAAQVASVLGKQAERIGDTAVAITEKITGAQRQKLQAKGILVNTKKQKKSK